MYYSNGNYEAFARPRKPENADQKSAYLVGAGLASLAAAVFMIRDGQMKGDKIHIIEELGIAGGACDGIKDPRKGFIIRGGREMESHFECLWDLFRSIPSLDTENASVLDEFYWLNKEDPSGSLMRVTEKCGQDAHTDGKFTLSDAGAMELFKLFITKNEDLYDKKITDVFTDAFLSSNFWLYWRTMFAFEQWHSALEMKLYVQRFIHHVKSLPDCSSLKFTRYNQYESLILPLMSYLKAQGVHFMYNTKVTNVLFSINAGKKTATQIQYISEDGNADVINLTPDDLVFVTNGSCTENSTEGAPDAAPVINTGDGGCWTLWKNIAKQDPAFGHPEKFCSNIPQTMWESATITTLDDKIPALVQKISKKDPFSGRMVTSGIITVRDSNWLMSYTVSRQPHFHAQPKGEMVMWVYGLFVDVPGNYIKKPMKECTGIEITEELLYHMGVPVDQILDMATKSAHCIPSMLPYITAFFMPRTAGDRPKVVPDGSTNFAFIGEFCETPRDTVFTTEFAVRTAMEAVYTLLEVDRGVPEVFDSCYDIRCLLEASSKLLDGKKPIDLKVPFFLNIVEKKMLEKIKGTEIEEMLKQYNVI